MQIRAEEITEIINDSGLMVVEVACLTILKF